MKNLLKFFTLGFILLMGMTSCGDDERDDVTRKLVLDYKIPASAWESVVDNNNNFLYFQCFIDEPKLTANIYNNAAVIPYLEVTENGTKVQKILPYIIDSWDNVSTFNWSIDFDYSVGSVGFYIQNSAFIEQLPFGNQTMTFRVVYVW
jgi:hypothetical protein